MAERLTTTAVRALEPSAKDVRVFDIDVSGFHVRVTPAGAKVFAVDYRAAGRKRRVALGAFGELTVDQAREGARRVRAEAALGGDPALDRAKKRKEPTLAEFVELWKREHAPTLKPKTRAEYERWLKLYVAPGLGTRRVTDIHARDVAAVLGPLAEKPTTHNRVAELISSLMGIAERWGYRPAGSNPCVTVRRNRLPRRERFLTELELARLGEHLDLYERAMLAPLSALRLVRALMLTGARRDELRTLKWAGVDVERNLLMLEDSKTGPQVRRLGATAVELFASIKAEAEAAESPSPWIFPALGDPSKPCPIPTLRGTWDRLRKAAKLEGVRLHDLRHTLASHAGAERGTLQQVGGLLGHRDSKTTARYQHLMDDPLRDLADRTSNRIARALAAGAKNSQRKLEKVAGGGE